MFSRFATYGMYEALRKKAEWFDYAHHYGMIYYDIVIRHDVDNYFGERSVVKVYLL